MSNKNKYNGKFSKAFLINSLRFSEEEADYIMKIQRKFPEIMDKDVDEKGFVVDGEKLCKELGIKDSFTNWLLRKTKGKVQGKLIKYGCVENVDYIVSYTQQNTKFSQEEIKEMSPQKRSAYGIKNKITLTLECAISIVERNINEYNKQRAIELLEKLNKKKQNNTKLVVVEKERKEIKFLDLLESVLEPFNLTCIRQHRVLNYRIDLYIEDLNIAIEYDELGHNNYSYEQEEGRQEKIEKELGCKFIRVSETKSDAYNVGLVMKKLFNINY